MLYQRKMEVFLKNLQYQIVPDKTGVYKYEAGFRQLKYDFNPYVYIIEVNGVKKFVGWTESAYKTIARHFSGGFAGKRNFVVDQNDLPKTRVGLIPAEPGKKLTKTKKLVQLLVFREEDPIKKLEEKIKKGEALFPEEVKAFLEEIFPQVLTLTVDQIQWSKSVISAIKADYIFNRFKCQILLLEEKLWEQIPF
ncbi:MAG TPA: hypothetical protein VJB09_00945 [Candidatus Paceibacterota bacterium]